MTSFTFWLFKVLSPPWKSHPEHLLSLIWTSVCWINVCIFWAWFIISLITPFALFFILIVGLWLYNKTQNVCCLTLLCLNLDDALLLVSFPPLLFGSGLISTAETTRWGVSWRLTWSDIVCLCVLFYVYGRCQTKVDMGRGATEREHSEITKSERKENTVCWIEDLFISTRRPTSQTV